MTPTEWITVAVAIAGGIAVGVIASRVVLAVIGSSTRPEPIREAAPAMASLALWAGIVVGLVIALGVVSPEALDQLPQDIVAFIPRLLAAAIIVIVANVLAAFATAALGPALGRLPARAQVQVLAVVRITILGLAALLAVRQLGFDTTVINLAVAAVFFGAAGALMLLVALGGRHVATEVASTRVARRLVRTGDRVDLGGDLEGTVVAVHPTAVELVTTAGRTLLVPSSRLIQDVVTVERADSDRARREPR